MANSKRVLMIDDDVRLLSAAKRSFRKHFDMMVASSAADAYAILRDDPDFSVVLCDQNMPVTYGSECLALIAESYPSITRVMLTGNNDLATAKKAVNDGGVFRLLSKPVKAEELIETVDDAHAFHVENAKEGSLLDQTLSGSLRMLTDILAFQHPTAAFHGQRTRHWMNLTASDLGFQNIWELDVVLSIAPLAWLFETTAEEETSIALPMNETTTKTLQELIGHVPRLETASQILGTTGKATEGIHKKEVFATGDFVRSGIFLATLCAISYRLGDHEPCKKTIQAAFKDLKRPSHDPFFDLTTGIRDVLIFALESHDESVRFEVVNITLNQLRSGDVLLQDIVAPNGKLLLAKNHKLTSAMAERLRTSQRVLFPGNAPRVEIMRPSAEALAA